MAAFQSSARRLWELLIGMWAALASATPTCKMERVSLPSAITPSRTMIRASREGPD
eukprot:CAMPEP_0171241850 /NCGR_PEP_ID=MMETSP0790-20130122/45326_1 /TAXON_ID=2925 /ORGANISM="Alexandrium catenella, Strain OF101" /LENGTH=55 /DNA_ID=CAMNT_0011708509 /DNA_START=31 /DNA_END=195 /DNA_ORIENTATION=-